MHSYASAINDANQATGVSDTGFADGAFRFSGVPGSGGVMVNLGSVDARAINNGGQVAGLSFGQAVVYSGVPGSGGSLANLGTLGGTSSGAYGINDSGSVVGTSQTTGDLFNHAFLYNGVPGSGGSMADLGTLGGTYSVAWDISNAGQIVGQAGLTGDAAGRAFVYSGVPGAGGSMADLGTLGGMNSVGYAINNAGQTAGTSALTGDTEYHAFLYSGTPGAGGTMVDLGTLGGDYSEAFGINDAGFVVGYSRRSTGPEVWPTLWLNDAAHTAIDLAAWLNTTNPAMGADWVLGSSSSRTIDINNNGLIVGTGYYNGPGGNGYAHAFMLDVSTLVPAPSSSVLLAVLGLSGAVRRRRSAAATVRETQATTE
ncbi:MAG: DUF3466 family protein [Planctomycetota bacterium]|nr:DUF3466 family protein [Planctomycetota bacterium]